MSSRRTPGRGPRVGFFGILGSGNLGNDGSLDAVVRYLAEWHPDARLDFFCMGPAGVAARYGAPATSLQWFEAHAGGLRGWRGVPLKVLGKLLDPVRTLLWVRRQDVVIVPGMGVLETTLPLRPWAIPYSMAWLGVLSRLCGVRVALVSVGANVIRQRLTRRLVVTAARLAHHRSYRDAASRAAMARMGVDVGADQVYPDLAFALPVPPDRPRSRDTVGLGVMTYHGSNDDRERTEEIHRGYTDTVTGFVLRMLDRGRDVRLFTGDPVDAEVVAEILAVVRERRPELGPDRIELCPATDLAELMESMAGTRALIATRYHNVLCALRTSTPTISLGYAHKHDALMDSMGVGRYGLSAREPDLELLVERFDELEARADPVARTLAEHNAAQADRLRPLFAELSRLLDPAGAAAPAADPSLVGEST